PGNADREGDEPAPGARPEGRTGAGRDRGGGRGEPAEGQGPGRPQEGTREDPPGRRRARVHPRGARKGGQARLDRADVEGARVGDEDQVRRGPRVAAAGTRE